MVFASTFGVSVIIVSTTGVSTSRASLTTAGASSSVMPISSSISGALNA